MTENKVVAKEPQDKNNEGILDLHIHFSTIYVLEAFRDELVDLIKSYNDVITHATTECYEVTTNVNKLN